MLNLTVVVPFYNQPELTTQALKFLVDNKTNPETKIVAFDNGSDKDIEIPEGVEYMHVESNICNYPVFKELTTIAKTSVIAVFHSDLFVYERGYDDKILQTFDENQQLGLVGFVGSNEIDGNGGRGSGTMSNFMGLGVKDDGGIVINPSQAWDPWTANPMPEIPVKWRGSKAEIHGRRETNFARAAVVDGCSMIFRRKALEEIGHRDNFPIHHFYDRLMSCMMLEKGWQVGVLGIQFDHISGQTANQEQGYHEIAQMWCEAHGLTKRTPDMSWDNVLYLEAERQFLTEYRDQKHLIPIKV